MTLPDDTQPRSPFQAVTPPRGTPAVMVEPEEPVRGGPGCVVMGLIGVVALGFALLIMILAGAAGWTSGQRIAQANATATQFTTINEQINRIPLDLGGGNLILAGVRLQYLATLTPGVSGLNELIGTATAVYLTNQPTLTPTPSPTETPAPTQTSAPEATLEAGTAAQGSGVSFDLNGLLKEAQDAIAVRDWDTAIDALDVIIRADRSFQANTVRTLMNQALTQKALVLFRSGATGDLAEAILLTDRAEEFGNIDDLAYESYIAGLYLEAISAVGINYPQAIRALSQLYSQVPTYRDVGQQLFSQYMAYGDAWVAQSEYCPAAVQYQNALNIINDASANGKFSNAQTVCSQATPVGQPAATADPSAPGVAPVGAPGT